MVITREKMRKDLRKRSKMFLWLGYLFIGTMVPILPFMLFLYNKYAIISFYVLGVLVGIPCGIIKGLKKIVTQKQEEKYLWSNSFTLVEDEVRAKTPPTDKQIKNNDCHLVLEWYCCQQSGKDVSITYDEFNNIEVGDKCILVIPKPSFWSNFFPIPYHCKPFLIYPGNDYEVDVHLQHLLYTIE